MADVTTGEQNLAADYEALVEFLYLAPVGIVKFRPDGTIDMANPTAAQLLMPLAQDGDMSDLYRLLAGLAPDLLRHVNNFRESAGQVFDQLPLVMPETGSTLMLDINKINPDTMMAVLQNVTDLTEARREVLRRTESQRLLASVFMRLNTPIVVIRADGFILLTNPAFQSLTGYSSKSLAGLNIDALLSPDRAGPARAARSQQMLDGINYHVEADIATRDGTRLRVAMLSTILHGAASRQLHVITLVPEVNAANGGRPGTAAKPDYSCKQVHSLDLAGIKAAVGVDWPFIADRALMLAELRVKPLLGPTDIIRRGKDDNFIVWFTSDEPAACRTALKRMEKTLRQLFLTEFGSKIAGRVLLAAG